MLKLIPGADLELHLISNLHNSLNLASNSQFFMLFIQICTLKSEVMMLNSISGANLLPNLTPNPHNLRKFPQFT